METDNKFIEMVKQIGLYSGMDELTTTIAGRLYLEPEPVAMEELAKETGYSLASISNKTKFLEQVRIVKKTRKPGSKKIYLYMEKDIAKIIRENLNTVLNARIKTAKESMPLIIEEYCAKARTEKDKKKLRILEDYYAQVCKFELILKDVIKKINND
jgi:DNA-binding transcriptional regulator GbsR (MarR family)